jgi:hypothetical protein
MVKKFVEPTLPDSPNNREKSTSDFQRPEMVVSADRLVGQVLVTLLQKIEEEPATELLEVRPKQVSNGGWGDTYKDRETFLQMHLR